MRLICYPTVEAPPVVRPAPPKRDWMTQSPGRFAYRCLPLVIANSHGWELLVDQAFAATWSGGSAASEMEISFLAESRSSLPASHFGEGVLTFQVGYLFETDERHNLWITGPINSPKDGIIPLSGVVETDWIPYTFTMNWMFTRPGTVYFERGEPFCHFFPVPRGLLNAVDPEIRDLEEVPDKARIFTTWRTSRAAAIDLLYAGQVRPADQGWDKHYYWGQTPDGKVVAEDHETRLAVKPFTDHTSLQVARPRGDGSHQASTPVRTRSSRAAEPGILPAERMVRVHFMGGGSQDPTVAFPDPLLSASIYCKDRLDEVLREVVAPFWRRLGGDREASQCYLWFQRSRNHLEVHLHGPDDQERKMRGWLEEALTEGRAGEADTEATLLWTGYRRSDSLGNGQLLLDPRYASLITSCLGRGCDLFLASLKPEEGRITHGSRRITFVSALVAGLSVLGLPFGKRYAYLAYHRDSLLREIVALGPGSAGLQKTVSFLDTRAEAFTAALQGLRRMIAEEWTGGVEPQPAPAELGSWQRSLSGLHEYFGRLRGVAADQLDRWAAEPGFVPLFKVCHGLANQAGMTPADEAFWCHLLVRAKPEG
jgi:hypothetical protein